MNSDKDYHPPGESLNGLRRSKRVTRSEKQPAKKTEEKPARKSTTKVKDTPAKKSKPSPGDKQTSHSTNGLALTKEELQQLFEKFTRDGHFHLNPPNTSPAPLVVSRTTDGKVVTTKIECYKQKRYLMRELAATMTSSKTDDGEHALLDNRNDPSAVIFSNPVPDTCRGTFNVNTSGGLYFPAEDKSMGSKKTKNCNQTRRDSASNGHRTSGLGNALPESPRSSNMAPKSFSTVLNSLANVPEIPSNSSAFSFVAPAKSQSPTLRANHILLRPNSSTWNSSKQSNSTVKKENCSTTSRLYFSSNNSSQNGYNGSVANRFNSNDSSNDPYGNLNNPSLQTINNPYNSTNLNSQNSAFPVRHQSSRVNSSSDWNSAGQMSSNTFAANNSSTILNNSINALPDNSMNIIPPSIIAYNSEIKSVNNCMYAVPTITNGLISDSSNTSEYRSSSFMSWNGVKVFPNNYSSAGDSSNCNMYGGQNWAGSYDASGTGIVNDSTNQMNSWSQNQQVNKGFFLLNGNGGDDGSTMPSNFLNNGNGPSISNFPVITNIDNDLTLPNGEQPAKGLFTLEDFRNIPDNGFGQSTSSVCPYDDDISYENYNGENLGCNDENLVSTLQNNGFFSNLLMSVRNEVRPLYDGGYNYSQFNNDSSMDPACSVYYDFDNKKEIIDTSDCIITEMSSQS